MNRILLSLFVVTVSATVLLGCSRRNYTLEEKADKVVDRVSKELDLTADQRTKLNVIKSEILSRKDLIESFKYGDIFDETLAQIRTENMDKEKLNTMLAQQEAKRTELRKLLVDKAAEFHATLTPQQRTKAAEKLGRFQQHWKW
jgi:protein CpxP